MHTVTLYSKKLFGRALSVFYSLYTTRINEFPYGLFVSLPFYDSPRERFVSLEFSLQAMGKHIFP